jgi:hypothetical protein
MIQLLTHLCYSVFMDKKSKILLIIVSVAILISVGVTFYKYVILKDYQIVAEMPCNPAVANCFVRTDEGGSVTNYQLLSRNASRIPLCDPNTNANCQALTCAQNEPNCEITSCSAETLPEGETCSGGE